MYDHFGLHLVRFIVSLIPEFIFQCFWNVMEGDVWRCWGR